MSVNFNFNTPGAAGGGNPFVTAVGGIVGGLVGLMLAVPITVLITKAFARARSADAVRVAAGRALTRVGLRQPATPLSPDPAPPSPSKQGEQG